MDDLKLWPWIWMHVCMTLPWHKLEHVEWTEGGSRHVRCKWCKHEYGINESVKTILPWEYVQPPFNRRVSEHGR